MFRRPLNVAPVVNSGGELSTELLDPADPDEKVSQKVHLEGKRERFQGSW